MTRSKVPGQAVENVKGAKSLLHHQAPAQTETPTFAKPCTQLQLQSTVLTPFPLAAWWQCRRRHVAARRNDESGFPRLGEVGTGLTGLKVKGAARSKDVRTGRPGLGWQQVGGFGGRHPQNRVGREGNLACEGRVPHPGGAPDANEFTSAAKFQFSGTDPFTTSIYGLTPFRLAARFLKINLLIVARNGTT
jgi:hypothetical protein